jgi:hypothetical protein
MSCVIVIGCFRSGTSAVAGLLHHLGVFMGSEFDNSTSHNRSGYWEDLEFKNFHKKMESLSFSDNDRSDYEKLIKSRQDTFELWGLKDPLLCLFLDEFLNNLDDVKIIVCDRDQEKIAQSMCKVLGYQDNYENLLKLVNFYVDSMNDKISKHKIPFLRVDHEALIQKTSETIHLICDFLNLEYQQSAFDYVKNH